MKQESKSRTPAILPVPRTKEEARRFYDRISRFYSYLVGAFERKYAEMALKRLSVYKIRSTEKVRLMRLPVEIAVAVKAE